MKLANDARLGSYVVDGNGRSLYYYAKDTPASAAKAAVSNCSGADGTKQTTFKGWPLYFFAGDVKTGDVLGEGVDEIDTLDPRAL